MSAAGSKTSLISGGLTFDWWGHNGFDRGAGAATDGWRVVVSHHSIDNVMLTEDNQKCYNKISVVLLTVIDLTLGLFAY